jgi:hypothetical protein
MPTVPGNDFLDEQLSWARMYISIGWPVFILGVNKQPVALCDRCRNENAMHDRQACTCLLCHGFYAATLDINRVAEMLVRHPEGQMAVRTGAASDLVVLDFESTSDGSELEVTGLDVLEQWEGWVGGWSLPKTLVARTESGGVHLFYSYSSVGYRVRQKIRPLPSMDVKAEGGYVAVPSALGHREWRTSPIARRPAPVGIDLANWLMSSPQGRHHKQGLSGRYSLGGTTGVSYDYDAALRDGPPTGMRDHFFNDMIFRMRKAGDSMETVEETALRIWERLPQDMDPFLWDWVLYKIDRVFATVLPSDILTGIQKTWARVRETHNVQVDMHTPGVQKHGRVTIVPRERRMGL